MSPKASGLSWIKIFKGNSIFLTLKIYRSAKNIFWYNDIGQLFIINSRD